MPAIMFSPIERHEWALKCLKDKKVRMTRPRRVILVALAKREAPVSLELLAYTLSGACNLATIYRTMNLFQKAGVVRQLNLTRRYASFVLNSPGRHYDYLMCNDCGAVSDLPDARIIIKLEKKLADHSGFIALQREIKFHGTCPKCQSASQKKPEI
jgi:Fe2+ or Zn2+ uptake regulation protein